jgi:hypothetical protein
MDMWERCIAIVNSIHTPTGDASDAVVVRSLRRMIAWSSLPFIVLFGAWYGIGILASAHHWVDDPNKIIPQLVAHLRAYAATGITGALTETLVVLCFSAAALSTIDGFIIAAVQTVIFDWLPSFTKDHRNWDQIDEVESRRWLRWSRLLVVLVGAVAVGIAYMSFGIMNFWVGMYSMMLSFFPAIFLSIQGGETFRSAHSAFQVALSIISGATVALVVAVLGTFVFPATPIYTALPPFLALGVSFIVLIPNPKAMKGVVWFWMVGGTLVALTILFLHPASHFTASELCDVHPDAGNYDTFSKP